jgi:hypothetical protein
LPTASIESAPPIAISPAGQKIPVELSFVIETSPVQLKPRIA